MARKYIHSKYHVDQQDLSVNSTPTLSFTQDSVHEEPAASGIPETASPVPRSSHRSTTAPGPSTPSRTHSTPLDLRMGRIQNRGGDVPVSEDPTGSKVNVLFSDMDPISTRLYLRALREIHKSSECSFPLLIKQAGQLEDVRERRRIRKNAREQQSRDEEKYDHYRMMGLARQIEQRNVALNATVEKLEAEKNELKADIYRHVGNLACRPSQSGEER